MCNDISEMLGIKVKNLKITQNLGLDVHKNVKALLYEGQLTYHPSACACCGIKNDAHL
ncbi:ISL3 family transposase, partial [Staphylococcus schleiferi subsp. schleiferi]